MARSISLFGLLFLGLAAAQTPITPPDVHPKLETWKCTKKGGCVSNKSAVVIDAQSHWNHQANNTALNCGSWGSAPDPSVCPDEATCAKNCVMEAITNYTAHGVTTKGSNLHLQHLAPDGSVLSPRVYLLAEGAEKYEMLKLTGGELAFDVDMSKLPCGMNGALYLSEMEETGGQSALNPGGAAWGTGYCDAQCFVVPFVNGVGNVKGQGICCNEMDIWESNSRATMLTPHTCLHDGPYLCTGETECSNTDGGECDKFGCSYNPYKLGNPNYYGRGLKVDTKRPFTVVTQFPTDASGTLTQIKRLYVQDGRVIQNAAINVTATGLAPGNSITDDYCTATGATRYMEFGGNKGMGDALARGMVLIFSVWWDESGNMAWLDQDASGPCNATEGSTANIRLTQPDTAVTFSKIKWGELDSTYSARRRR